MARLLELLSPLEWGRLRELARTKTIAEWRKLNCLELGRVATRRLDGKVSVSMAVHKRCEQWCKDA